jgi:hypothetical protein
MIAFGTTAKLTVNNTVRFPESQGEKTMAQKKIPAFFIDQDVKGCGIWYDWRKAPR